jgi:hypothetical protein
VWEILYLPLRRKLISELKDIAEVDFAVDFVDVFMLGLFSDDPEICVSAIDGLAECEDIRILPRLFELMQQFDSEHLQISAINLLGSFVLLGELNKIHEAKFAAVVEKLLAKYHEHNTSDYVKIKVLESLAYTSSWEVPTLIQQTYDRYSSDDERLSSIIFSMGRSADKRWAKAVIKELNNPNPSIRLQATRACGELQLKEVISELIELTDDVDIEIQEMAIWALGQVGGSRARKTLNTFTNSENEALSAAAQSAIDELDFFENGLSSFLGPPSEFDGEGEESWMTPEGYFKSTFPNYVDNNDNQIDDEEYNQEVE